jgi:hypothetical protein
MNRKTIRTRAGVTFFAAVLCVLTVSEAAAQKRIEFLNNGRGVQSITVPQTRTPGKQGAVQIHGPIDYSHRDGFTVDGKRVVFSRTTSIYPDLRGDGRMLNPSDVRGRSVTVFGRQTRMGVQAVLVIVDPREGEARAERPVILPEGFVDMSVYQVPSENDPDVGEYNEDVPR